MLKGTQGCKCLSLGPRNECYRKTATIIAPMTGGDPETKDGERCGAVGRGRGMRPACLRKRSPGVHGGGTSQSLPGKAAPSRRIPQRARLVQWVLSGLWAPVEVGPSK